MRVAFKEWAIVVDALARGTQIVILRKGGIHEGRGGFQVEHPRFLFFPTLYHQQQEKVVPEAQRRYEQIRPGLAAPEVVRIEHAAEVVAWRRLESLEVVQRLRGQHVWREEVLVDRFDWGRDKQLFALAVRVSRLPARIELPMRPEYGGCRSWVEVEADVSLEGAVPVLDADAFDGRLRVFESALGGQA